MFDVWCANRFSERMEYKSYITYLGEALTSQFFQQEAPYENEGVQCVKIRFDERSSSLNKHMREAGSPSRGGTDRANLALDGREFTPVCARTTG